MKTLNVPLMGTLLALSLIACPLLYFYVGPALDAVQLDVLKTLLLLMGASVLYCFVVGEQTGNNSQMDKLWSILPPVYVWVIAAKAGFSPRLVVMAVLATAWGCRLTFNFARKGAYRLKFWEGEEDYRWKVLRESKDFQPHWKWMLFNLFFISFYQNALILLTTFPALVSMHSTLPFSWVDGLVAVLMGACIIYETVADEQQWAFQSKKWEMLKQGAVLQNLPAPYNRGFNTVGLWGISRHPNYLAEQSTWVCFYLFSVGAGLGLFNWSLIGALLLVVLFQGSAAFAEDISSAKYPEYQQYCRQVSRFFPGKRYNPDSSPR